MRQILAVAAVAGLLTAGCATAEEVPAPQTAAVAESFETPEADLQPTDPEPQSSTGDTAEVSQPSPEPADTEPVDAEPADTTGDTEPADTTGDSSEPADGVNLDNSAVEPGDGAGADSAAAAEPDMSQLDETETLQAPQPVWQDGTTPQDYFAELIPWMLDADDPAVNTCLTDAFVGSFSDLRLNGLAAATVDTDLSSGFAAGLMSDDETESLVNAMEPCAAMSLQTALDPDSPFPGLEVLMGEAARASTPEIERIFETGMVQCLTDLATEDGFVDLIVRDALFENRDIEDEITAATFRVCADSLLVPLIVESLVAETGVERVVAQCAMDEAYPALQEAVGGSPDEMGAGLMTFGFEMMFALSECGASIEDLMS